MKHFYLSILFLIISFTLRAAHITGGEMLYDYIGTSGGLNKYRITLRLYRDDNCTGCAAMPASVAIGIFNNDMGNLMGGYRTVGLNSNTSLTPTDVPTCITNPPNLRYSLGTYTFETELSSNLNGYTITYQTCCRISGIRNVPDMEGATYSAVIPGTSRNPGSIDNSPRFTTNISIVCYQRPFTLDFSASDPDGDSLVYNFCSAYNGGRAADAAFAEPDGPPYGTISYINGYNGTQPLGPQATINPATGIISGIAPQPGRYVVSVCVDQFRNRQYLSTQRKDFIITVAPCDLPAAELLPSYITCDGFSYTFSNLSSSPLNESVFWDFDVPGTLADTSISETPTFTFPDTGIYKIKLIVNKGKSCTDSTTALVSVYPGFVPAFNNSSPSCVNVPVSFTDRSSHRYGTVVGWSWDFGDSRIITDTSNLKNPTFAYSTPGTYNTRLIVTSSRGCKDTVSNTVTIVDKPQFFVSNDTLICTIDTLQLHLTAGAPGTVVWSPNYNISNVTSLNPFVSPDVTTTYIATFRDNFGCEGKDSVTVNVISRVSLDAGPDTTICRTDSVIIPVRSDGLRYNWTPSSGLSSATDKNPLAFPFAASTTYSVTASVGKCNTTDRITIKTVPYPVARASNDTSICAGKSVTISASGGSIYQWRPVIYLSNPNASSTQVVSPQQSIKYFVSVRDTFGCPKPVYDTVLVNVAVIVADAGPRDTSVVLGQPLQLFATGGTKYEWSPATYLNNTRIANPISLPQNDIEYSVKVSDNNNCFSFDSIRVHVYNLPADLYVPSAFTPDKDGLNETFKPIPIGMRAITLFRIYNRWGQLVFSSTNPETGWDGKFNGVPQSPGSFVWIAEGITYDGKKISKKGSMILIR